MGTEENSPAESIPQANTEAFSTSSMEPESDSLQFHGPDTLIGPYRLLQRIGHGGMGEVWLAEQRDPIRRRVALKLIKPGFDTREVIARFHSERQALAMMNHPAIAKVFDAGSTPEGRPYFAMEYVPGLPITDYCNRHKLSLRQRLELFISVCEGVQHAHQRGIIHRDLKPSNILVAEGETRAIPKIIDFGVAKAISQPLTAGTMYTRVGSVIGTVEYMSPEQADPTSEDIDTRADIYSLGVVLYELLVAKLPVERGKKSLNELLPRLPDEEIMRPSSRLRSLGTAATAIATDRGTDSRELARSVQGDLDCIVLKALERERARRYNSASEFAADIAHYLNNEPIVAAPASATYRLRKYARRHRVSLAGGTTFVVLLVSFVIVQSIQLRRISRERDRADRTAKFMTGLFRANGPTFARGANRTATDILSDGLKQLDTSLSDDPELQANMLEVFGKAYSTVGFDAKAETLFTRAYNLRRQALGENRPETVRALGYMAQMKVIQCRSEEQAKQAEPLARRALETQLRVLGPDASEAIAARENLGRDLAVQKRFGEAEEQFRQALVVRRKLSGPGDPLTLRLISAFADVLYSENKLNEAELLLKDALRTQGKRPPEETSPYTILTNQLLHVMMQEGKLGELMDLARESVTSRGDYLPANLLLSELRRNGNKSEAERVGLAVINLADPSTSPSRAKSVFVYNFACVEALLGKREEAIARLREALQLPNKVTAKYIASDPDLASLRGDPRFQQVVEQYRHTQVK